MIIVFLVDTSVSMNQELSTALDGEKKPIDSTKDKAQDGVGGINGESLFGGNRDEHINRRWRRKAQSKSGTQMLGTTTRLDCAKTIVEQIINNRQTFEHDRYMLVTYNGSGNGYIKSNLKDNRKTLLQELRSLKPTDRFHGGTSLTTLFNQLSLMRSAYDLDTYGYGRYPTLNEPVQILWLTDGASVVMHTGISSKLNLPVNSTPWVESYTEPFRWDQRLILVFLHEQGDKSICIGGKHSGESVLMPMCTVMGGTAHHVGSMRQAQRFVEVFSPVRVSARTQGIAMGPQGVLVNFERIDDNPANPRNTDTRVLLHVAPSNVPNAPLPPPIDATQAGPKNTAGPTYGNSSGVSALINGHLGYFPIPEPFWPEVIRPPPPPNQQQQQGQQPQPQQQTATGWQVPRRNAHPTLCYSQSNTDWAVPAQFPFDKYQIDSNSNVAQKLLAASHAAQTAHEAQGGKGAAKPICWQVFVNGSYTNPKYAGFPFGILRANSTRTAVNLFILPYNFTALWKILSKLDSPHGSRASIAMSPQWRREFEEYLQHTPGYYAIPLKRAFNLYGIPHGVFPKTFGQTPGMRNVTHYSMKINTITRKEWDRLQPSPANVSDPVSALSDTSTKNLTTLLTFDPISDASRLVTNAFDVARADCMVTLGSMRRMFIRECMVSHRAYFRPNSVIPPTPMAIHNRKPRSSIEAESEMDIDSNSNTWPTTVRAPSTPPPSSIEYSFYGSPYSIDSSTAGQSQFSTRQRNPDIDMQNLEPGAQLSPLGGVVDVASEDDHDSRHIVPIREMGEYGIAMHRSKLNEARDPLLDERTALLQRRNMFGNPYRRPLREPRGPTNNVIARNPMLSAKLGLNRSSRSSPANAATVARETEDDMSIEMESEAESELAMDKIFEDMAPTDGSNNNGNNNNNNVGKFGWVQRRNVPRRRSIATGWKKDNSNPSSWNVNPWAVAASEAKSSTIDLGALTFTSDSVIINKNTAQIICSATSTNGQTESPAHPSFNEREGTSEDAIDSNINTNNVLPAKPIAEPLSTPSNTSADFRTKENALQIIAPEPEMISDDASNDDNDPFLINSIVNNPSNIGRTDIGSSPVAENRLSNEKPAIPTDLNNVIYNNNANSNNSNTTTPNSSTKSNTSSTNTTETTSSSSHKINVAEEKAWFLKRIKADPAHYDEGLILQRVKELQEPNAGLSKAQLKIIITAAMTAAKSMRRKQLVEQLTKISK